MPQNHFWSPPVSSGLSSYHRNNKLTRVRGLCWAYCILDCVLRTPKPNQITVAAKPPESCSHSGSCVGAPQSHTAEREQEERSHGSIQHFMNSVLCWLHLWSWSWTPLWFLGPAPDPSDVKRTSVQRENLDFPILLLLFNYFLKSAWRQCLSLGHWEPRKVAEEWGFQRKISPHSSLWILNWDLEVLFLLFGNKQKSTGKAWGTSDDKGRRTF